MTCFQFAMSGQQIETDGELTEGKRGRGQTEAEEEQGRAVKERKGEELRGRELKIVHRSRKEDGRRGGRRPQVDGLDIKAKHPAEVARLTM